MFMLKSKHHDTALLCLRQQKEIEDLKEQIAFLTQLEGYYRKWYKEVSHKLNNPRDEKGRFCGVTVVQ